MQRLMYSKQSAFRAQHGGHGLLSVRDSISGQRWSAANDPPLAIDNWQALAPDSKGSHSLKGGRLLQTNAAPILSRTH